MTEDEIRKIVRDEVRKMQKEDYENHMLKLEKEKLEQEKYQRQKNKGNKK